MDASLKKKLYALLASVSRHCLSHPVQETDYSLPLNFHTRLVQIHPPFNILALPNWLVV